MIVGIDGIDLGTTKSLCAVFKDGKLQLIPNAQGGFLTPSIVAILEDGSVLVGDAAKVRTQLTSLASHKGTTSHKGTRHLLFGGGGGKIGV